MRIAFAAGGTGGHLYPALGVAGELVRRDPASECFFLVSRRGVERRVLEGSGFPFAELPASAFGSICSYRVIPALARMILAYREAGRLMRARGVQALVGFGAYASVPPALSARAMGIGVVIHEANAVMGRANRLLARVADAVALGMPSGEHRRADTRCEVIGIPLRPGIVRGMARTEARRLLELPPDGFTLLVMGGSQGARALNDAAAGAAGILAREKGMQVVHLAGERGCGEVREAYRRAGLAAVVFPYLEEMERAYAAADLVVCRAGAMTLAELAQAWLPAITVPFPRAVGNHQEANARLYEKAGGTETLLERDLTPAGLAERVIRRAKDTAARERMSRAMRGLARPDAAERLADLIEKTVRACERVSV
jgi:UDP-N-acetylglucosamine--N-acetylmuramyl-(pentapeptide) pyrophosphoryl-undecaprenol N-acetylglucosamine transferase